MDRVSGLDPASGTFMDANMSKQMAALNAVSQARMANRSFAGNGISSGGINTPNLPGPLLDTSMSRPGQPGKMVSVISVVNTPCLIVNSNHRTFCKVLQVSWSNGTHRCLQRSPDIRLRHTIPKLLTSKSSSAGLRLVRSVWQGGTLSSSSFGRRSFSKEARKWQVASDGSHSPISYAYQVTANNLWNGIAAALELPEESPASLPGNVSIAQTLQSYYQAILQPFEEMYRRKMSEQQKRAQTLKPAIISPSSTSSPSTNQASSSIQAITQEPHSKSHGSTDQDADGLKRKTEGEEAEGKRARQRVGSYMAMNKLSYI